MCTEERGSHMTEPQAILALMKSYSAHLPGSFKQKQPPFLFQCPQYNRITHWCPLFQAHRTMFTSIDPSVLVHSHRQGAKKEYHKTE